ncbi:MAG: hypothetical protein R2748_09240 [Bryobacterales bacterium]
MDGDGKGKAIDIPADMADAVAAAREALTEAVAESDEELLNEYLERTWSSRIDKLVAGLKKGILSGEIFPVLCTSGLQPQHGRRQVDGFPRRLRASPLIAASSRPPAAR